MLFTPLAGVTIDRYNRRDLLIGVRAAFVALALPLAALVTYDVVEVWHMVVVSLAAGELGRGRQTTITTR